jgi:hypothetical protein
MKYDVPAAVTVIDLRGPKFPENRCLPAAATKVSIDFIPTAVGIRILKSLPTLKVSLHGALLKFPWRPF